MDSKGPSRPAARDAGPEYRPANCSAHRLALVPVRIVILRRTWSLSSTDLVLSRVPGTDPVLTEEWYCGGGSPEGDAFHAHPFRSGRIGAPEPLAAHSITFPTRIGFVATIWNAVAGSVMPGSHGDFLPRPK